MANNEDFKVKNGLVVKGGNITLDTASATVDGRDVSVDGTKLDTIETGATADQTPAEILTAIKTVDGTGSGLDADLLDGKDASEYVQSTGTQVANQVAVFDGDGTVDGDSNLTWDGAALGVTGNVTVTGTVDGRDLSVDGAKLDAIDAGATDDQTAAEILTAIKTVDGAGSGLDADLLDGQSGTFYTGYTDTAISNLIDSAPGALDTLDEIAAALGDDANFAGTMTTSLAGKLSLSGGAMTGAITTNSTFDGRDVAVDGAKLDGIEAGATADQTDAEIKTAYENNANTNAFTDADETKLDGLEAGATGDQTDAEIKTAYENNANTNAFTDADETKLDGIEALADVTDATNVDAAGAVMNTDTTTAAMSFVIDEDAFTSDSATKIPTQQSVKAYVDTQVGAVPSAPVNSVNAQTGVVVLDADDISDAATTNKFATAAELSKLAGIEAGATGDQTDAEIKTAYENNANTNAFTDADETKLDGLEAGATGDQTDAEIKTAYENNANTNAFTDADETKLDGIEAGATADQTAAEILAAVKTVDGAGSGLDADLLDGQSGTFYTGYTDTAISNLIASAPAALDTLDEIAAALGDDANFAGTMTTSLAGKLSLSGGAMTGAITTNSTFDGRDVAVDGSKLDGIEAGATADQTDAEIKTAYENNANTNAFTDADETKLDGLEAGATADQTDAEIKTAYENNANTNAFTDADETKLDGLVSNANHTGEVTGSTALTITSNAVTADKLNVTGNGTGTQFLRSDGDGSFTWDTPVGGVTSVNAQTGAVVLDADDISDAATTNKFATAAELSKLAGIEAGATDDQTDAEIKTAYENNANTNAFTDAEKTKLTGIETGADVTDATNVDAAGAVMNTDTSAAAMSFVVDDDAMTADSETLIPTQQSVKAYVDSKVVSSVEYKGGYDASANSPDLDTAPSGVTTGDMYTVTVAGTFFTTAVEVGDVLIAEVDSAAAEADWTIVNKNLDASSIKVAYESNADTNAFSDAEQTKLAGSETGATADQTGAEIKTLYEAETNTNAFTDAAQIKLAGIEAGATGDQTDAEIKTAYENNANTNAFTDAEQTKLTGIETGATADQTPAEILTAIKTVDGTGSGLDADLFDGLNSTAFATSAQGTLADSALQSSDVGVSVQGYSAILAGTTASFLLADETKLDGLEAGATADQTDAEIKTAYENNANTNAFTDADETKLDGLVSNANHTGEVTGSTALTIASNAVTADKLNVTGNGTGTQFLRSDGDGSFTWATPAVGGAVDSVNAQTGVVVLDADDISDAATTNKFATAAELSKLAGIEAGATDDQTAAEILTAIKTVDGAGSGLDADLLDGNSSAFFTDYTDTAISNLIASAPAALDTLDEIAAALGDDANFAGTMTTSLAGKLSLTGGAMTGAITTNSTFDGRDVSVDGSKLDGIEALADVTDATNVNAAGAVMNTDTTTAAMSFVIDEDTFASDSATKVPTQQSVKAYVDANGGGQYIETAGVAVPTTGYNGGDIWYDTTNEIYYALVELGGSPIWLDIGGAGGTDAGGGASITIQTNAPGSPTVGDLYFDDTEGRLYIYYDDGDSQQWVDTSPPTGETYSTPAELLSAISTVDGTGSGLDADLLDGVQASSFIRSDAADSFSGALTGTGSLNISGSITTSSTLSGSSVTVGANTFTDGGTTTPIWNGNNVWTAGNDGTGSGLDADTVDGIQAASFIRSDAADTVTANTTWEDGNEIQFGTTPSSILFGTAARTVWRISQGQIRIQDNTTANIFQFAPSGDFTATGDIIANGTISDIRRKENIVKIDNALEKISQISGYTFNYIGKDTRMTGVMAQEVEKVLPEVVFETRNIEDDEPTKAVRNANMVGLLVEAIKEQQAQIDELKTLIENQSTDNNLKGFV